MLPPAAPSEHQLGPVHFKRLPSKVVALAFYALAGVLFLMTAMLVLSPPEENADPTTSMIIIGSMATLLALIAFRLGGRGHWFHARGFRVHGFFSHTALLYTQLAHVRLEDLVVNYRGHHHTVLIHYEVGGRKGKVLLAGRVSVRAGFDEERDPDADAIFALFKNH